MPKEIERKFLVDATHQEVVALLATRPAQIRQGYLKSDATGVVRVRISDPGDTAPQGFLTIKSAGMGIARDEYEYAIPADEAAAILEAMCPKVIVKQRFRLPLAETPGLVVELDVFPQIGLLLAEVELPDEMTDFVRPAWLLEEVSEDPSYRNNAIIERI